VISSTATSAAGHRTDDGQSGLAPALLGHADDGVVGHGRLLVENSLDLGRLHVISAEIITSLARSTMLNQPSLVGSGHAPLLNHPPLPNAAAVSTGRSR
jgi:hypothetical protein